jgi:hypothetical protein
MRRRTLSRSLEVSAAIPFAIAGTGYGLIGILVIIVLVLVIWRLI